jgi:hypothetical protein
MGIKFLCHHCEYPMHVKDFLAGKRGKCPQCGGSIRIPASGEEYSSPIANGARTPENTSQEISSQENAPLESLDAIANGAAIEGEVSESRPQSSSGATNTEHTAKSEIEMPDVISDAPNAAWYVRPPSGGQYGPAIGSVFWDWLNEKRVGENSLVWREGWGTWQAAKDVFPDFFRPAPPPAKVKAVAPPTAAPPPIQTTHKPEVRTAVESQRIAGVDTNVESRRNVQLRRKKSHSRNLVILVGLSILALVLVVILVVVLTTQKTG